MGSDEEVPWDAYARSIVEIELHDATVRIEPRSAGTTTGRYPDHIEVIHVITAHNPSSRSLPAAENERRNEVLEEAMGEVGWSWRPALGASADGDDPWEEASFAVLDETRVHVLEMAVRFGQAAIYEWTRELRAVVPTTEERLPLEHGWHAAWR